MIMKGLLLIIRWVFILALITFLWRIIRTWLFGRSAQPVRGPRAAQDIGKTVRDPVCGTYVAAELALPGPSQGTPIYFCSEECRRKYLATPLESNPGGPR